MQMCDRYGKFIMKPAMTSNIILSFPVPSVGFRLINTVANRPIEVFLSAKSSDSTKIHGSKQNTIEKIYSDLNALNCTPSGLGRTFFCKRLFLIRI